MFIYDALDPMNPVLVSTLSQIGRGSSVHNCWLDADNKVLYARVTGAFPVRSPGSRQ